MNGRSLLFLWYDVVRESRRFGRELKNTRYVPVQFNLVARVFLVFGGRRLQEAARAYEKSQHS